MKKQLLLALALAAAPFAASANDLSYTYVEGSLARMNLDLDGFGDVDFDGGQLRGSVKVADALYLFGGYGRVRNDDAGIDIDFNESQFGLGFRAPVGAGADFIAEIGLVRQEIKAVGERDHADGGRLSLGFRGQSGGTLEGWVKGSYNDGGDFDGDFSATLGAQLKFNPTWGLVAEIEHGDLGDLELTRYSVGVRASF